jgi:hypothetical protein
MFEALTHFFFLLVSGYLVLCGWQSLIHLDLSFVQGNKNGSIHILLHANHQLTQEFSTEESRMAEKHLKKFNILNHQGNANQNNPEIPPHTSQNG